MSIPRGFCVYLYPKPFLAEQPAGAEEMSGEEGERGKQGMCLWPFFPLLKPKGSSKLNDLSLCKRPGECQCEVKFGKNDP